LSLYGLTDLVTSSEHTLALGPSVKLSFNFVDNVDTTQACVMHAHHVYEEKAFSKREEIELMF